MYSLNAPSRFDSFDAEPSSISWLMFPQIEIDEILFDLITTSIL